MEEPRPGETQSDPEKRPILAVDIDGVVSLFGYDEPPDWPGIEFEMIDGKVHCISKPVGDLLRDLSDHFEIVWATGWEEGALQIGDFLGVPQWPYLAFGGSARFGSADWKLEPLSDFAHGRPLAWIDDSLDERCYQWARAREEPTLLIETESGLGLQGVHVEALVAWARSLGAT